MALSFFDDKKAPPADSEIAQALGRSGPAWVWLKDAVISEHGLVEDWGFAGPKFGWSLRLRKGKRVIVYMTPCARHFLASFVLGEKACSAAREAALPEFILTVIAAAPKYAEGRGFRIPVTTLKQARALAELAAIKAAH